MKDDNYASVSSHCANAAIAFSTTACLPMLGTIVPGSVSLL